MGDMQHGQKMGGRIGMRYTGPRKVVRAKGYEVAPEKNGRKGPLFAKNLKVYRALKASRERPK